MQDKGLGPTSLGRAAGLSQNYVSEIISGARIGSRWAIAAIADVFGMTGSQLEDTRPDPDATVIELAS